MSKRSEEVRGLRCAEDAVGDPDLQGRRIDDIKGPELADVLKKRQQNSIERAPFNGGDPERRIGGPARCPRSLGRRHAGRRDDELQRTQRLETSSWLYPTFRIPGPLQAQIVLELSHSR
jgi:hypothetical protein